MPDSPPSAGPLERAWLALATAALVAAALCALVVAAARAPWFGVNLGLQSVFAPALVVHVVLATIVWLLGVGAARWIAIARWQGVVARSVLVTAALSATLLVPALGTGAQARLFDYLPLLDHPLFLAGLGGFGLAVVTVAGSATAMGRRTAGEDAAALALRCALLPLWMTVGVLVLSWIKLSGAPVLEHGEWLFWAPGHTLQFVFTALMTVAWLTLSPAGASGSVRGPVWLTVLPVLFAPLPFCWHAIDSEPFRRFYTLLMAFGGWIGPLLLALVLVRATRKDRRSAFVTLSIVLFALGSFVGALIGALRDGGTTIVPAHYHGTVGAATLAAMGLVLSRLGERRSARDGLPWLHFAGLAMIVIGFAVAAVGQAPRKMPGDIDRGVAMAGLALMSIGAACAIAAVLWFGRRALGLVLAARAQHIDRRPLALAATAASVVALGGVFAWRADSPGAPPAAGESAEIRLRFDQGVVMLHARRYEHAITAFHRVLALAPQMPEAYVNMGFALLGAGRHREAADFFAATIELRSDQMNAYYGLAVAREAAGDLRGAAGAMRAYVHRADVGDPHRRKGEAALWEWEAQLARAAPATRSGVRR